ncbi:MAG: hypothetical protein JWR77_1928, partial [Rhizorhabdus sp.]|nr:hypothetical protein [Rhizorhabdus sp.]
MRVTTILVAAALLHASAVMAAPKPAPAPVPAADKDKPWPEAYFEIFKLAP